MYICICIQFILILPDTRLIRKITLLSKQSKQNQNKPVLYIFILILENAPRTLLATTQPVDTNQFIETESVIFSVGVCYIASWVPIEEDEKIPCF